MPISPLKNPRIAAIVATDPQELLDDQLAVAVFRAKSRDAYNATIALEVSTVTQSPATLGTNNGKA